MGIAIICDACGKVIEYPHMDGYSTLKIKDQYYSQSDNEGKLYFCEDCARKIGETLSECINKIRRRSK